MDDPHVKDLNVLRCKFESCYMKQYIYFLQNTTAFQA